MHEEASDATNGLTVSSWLLQDHLRHHQHAAGLLHLRGCGAERETRPSEAGRQAERVGMSLLRTYHQGNGDHPP